MSHADLKLCHRLYLLISQLSLPGAPEVPSDPPRGAPPRASVSSPPPSPRCGVCSLPTATRSSARGPRRCPRRATAHARGRSRRVRLGGSGAGGGGDRRDAAASAPATGAAVTSAEGCGAPTVRPGGEVSALRAPGLRTAAGPSKDPGRTRRTVQSPVPAGHGPVARDGDTRRPGPTGSLGEASPGPALASLESHLELGTGTREPNCGGQHRSGRAGVSSRGGQPYCGAGTLPWRW